MEVLTEQYTLNMVSLKIHCIAFFVCIQTTVLTYCEGFDISKVYMIIIISQIYTNNLFKP